MTTASQLQTAAQIAAAPVCCSTVGSAAFDDGDAVELARGFAALSDPVRLHLLSLIAACGPDGACVCDLVGPVGRSQPTVSHHLKVLREAGLVSADKRGTWAWYRIERSTLERLQRSLG